MGLNADITVHGWRKPTLTLELVEGGSLAADTKHYIVGIMGYTPSTYLAIGGPTSDVYEILLYYHHLYTIFYLYYICLSKVKFLCCTSQVFQ